MNDELKEIEQLRPEEYANFPRLNKEIVDYCCDSLVSLAQTCIQAGYPPSRYGYFIAVQDYDAFYVVPEEFLAKTKKGREGLTLAGTGEVLIANSYSQDRRHCLHETLHRSQMIARGILNIKKPKQVIAEAMGYKFDNSGELTVADLDPDTVMADKDRLLFLYGVLIDGLTEWSASEIAGNSGQNERRYPGEVEFIKSLEWHFAAAGWDWDNHDERRWQDEKRHARAVFLDAALTSDLTPLFARLSFGEVLALAEDIVFYTYDA